MSTKGANRKQRRARQPKTCMLVAENLAAPGGVDLLIIENGVTIARRGYPDTPEAGTWVSLFPGVTVRDTGPRSIEVEHTAAGTA